MIGKIFAKSKGSFKKRIDYIFGLSEHDHKIEFIETIGGNFFCQDPLPDIKNGNDQANNFIISEFNTVEQLRKKSIDSNRKIKPVFHATLSLPKDEFLTKKQWSQAVKYYMFGLGFSNSNKFIAVLHKNTMHQHVHIVANRIKFKKDFKLVCDSNERLKSIEVISEIEDIFKLKKTIRPSETWGVTINQADFKRWVISNELPFKQLLVLKIASAITITAEKHGDMFMFAKLLRRQNIYISFFKNNSGQPTGIIYEHKGIYISGSRLKKSRLTWSKIIKEEGIRYSPNSFLELEQEIKKRNGDIDEKQQPHASFMF